MANPLFKAVAVLAVCACATGCAARMATVSNQNSAYAARASVFGSDMYYCTASQPQQPVCVKVEEN